MKNNRTIDTQNNNLWPSYKSSDTLEMRPVWHADGCKKSRTSKCESKPILNHHRSRMTIGIDLAVKSMHCLNWCSKVPVILIVETLFDHQKLLISEEDVEMDCLMSYKAESPLYKHSMCGSSATWWNTFPDSALWCFWQVQLRLRLPILSSFSMGFNGSSSCQHCNNWSST